MSDGNILIRKNNKGRLRERNRSGPLSTTTTTTTTTTTGVIVSRWTTLDLPIKKVGVEISGRSFVPRDGRKWLSRPLPLEEDRPELEKAFYSFLLLFRANEVKKRVGIGEEWLLLFPWQEESFIEVSRLRETVHDKFNVLSHACLLLLLLRVWKRWMKGVAEIAETEFHKGVIVGVPWIRPWTYFRDKSRERM